MKKMPCAVERKFEGGDASLTGVLTPGCEEWIEAGIATRKRDGTAVMMRGGILYARYDAKAGKVPPADAIPCQPEPDPVTGHWPHWIPATRPEDKWIREAYQDSCNHDIPMPDGTYEACGPRINSNHEGLRSHILFRHGTEELEVSDRTFAGLRDFLNNNNIEGIVFWYDGEPRCKVRRNDFGFSWPKTEEV